MTDDILRAQLVAVRAQLAAAHATIDACLMILEPAPPSPVEGCQHPPDKVVSNDTLTARGSKCLQCGAEWPE